MIVYLTLTAAGTDTGPFDLYSDIDAFAIPFEIGVLKATLVSGYSTTVPDNAVIVRIQSTDNCVNYKDIILYKPDCTPFAGTAIISTFTTTTTTTATPTTTTTTTIAPTTTTTTTTVSPTTTTTTTVVSTTTTTTTVSPTTTTTTTMAPTTTTTTTVAPTTTTTTTVGTTTTTTTVSPTTTTTTTLFAMANDTAILDLQSSETYDLAFTDVTTESIIQVYLPNNLAGSEDTAHTATKLYQNTQGSYNGGSGEWDNLIRIWDITIGPWTAAFDQDMIFQACADDLGRSGLGLVMKDTNTIIGSFYPDSGSGYTDPWEIHEIDITNPGAVTTSRIWDLPWASGGDFYFVSGDFLYVDNGGTPKLIVTTEHWNNETVHLMQFDYATGNLEINKDITSDVGGSYKRPFGLFQEGSKLYLTNSHNTLTKIYEIELTSPWGLTDIYDITPLVAGASQIPSAMTEILVAPTTTTTTTASPTTTTTTT